MPAPGSFNPARAVALVVLAPDGEFVGLTPAGTAGRGRSVQAALRALADTLDALIRPAGGSVSAAEVVSLRRLPHWGGTVGADGMASPYRTHNRAGGRVRGGQAAPPDTGDRCARGTVGRGRLRRSTTCDAASPGCAWLTERTCTDG